MANLPLNRKISEIRFKSYYLKGKLINSFINLYLKFDNDNWYEITISDGKSSFDICEEPLLSNGIEKNKDDFYYPIKTINEIKLELLGKLTKIEEYLWNGQEDESCGLELMFDNGTNLRIIEKEDTLLLNSMDDKEIIKYCTIKEFK